MKRRHLTRFGSRLRDESGQTIILFLLALGIFLLAAVGFGVDFANFWFHRQAAQTAADAACTAGAMDLLADATNGITTQGGFDTSSGAFGCSGSTAAPCKYAALNGYDGGGTSPGNDVNISFPTSITGVTTPPGGLAPVPFIRVDVNDHVQTYFSGLLTGQKTQDVRALAKCGLIQSQSPIPIVVLNPTLAGSLSVSGTPTIAVIGGPTKSIQVNSSNAAAVYMGASAGINLACGDSAFTGSQLGVFGGPTTPPVVGVVPCPGTPIPSTFPAKGGGFNPGSTGSWQTSPPIGDPFAQIPAPPSTGTSQPGPWQSIPNTSTTNGCPDTKYGCDEYAGGYYPSGITVKNKTALFDPGVYYLNGGLGLMANSFVRPSTVIGDGSGGAIFYLTGATQKCSGQTGLVCVGSDSGGRALDPYCTTYGQIWDRASSTCLPIALNTGIQCAGGAAPDPKLGIPPQLSGNILLAPCTGTYGDPSGKNRGMLFFQDRSSANGGGWGGGGGFLLAGSMYFHQCNASGTGTSCLSTEFNSGFSLQGSSGSNSYVLGEIITDTLSLGGNPSVIMALNPFGAYQILKASLLQ